MLIELINETMAAIDSNYESTPTTIDYEPTPTSAELPTKSHTPPPLPDPLFS